MGENESMEQVILINRLVYSLEDRNALQDEINKHCARGYSIRHINTHINHSGDFACDLQILYIVCIAINTKFDMFDSSGAKEHKFSQLDPCISVNPNKMLGVNDEN